MASDPQKESFWNNSSSFNNPQRSQGDSLQVTTPQQIQFPNESNEADFTVRSNEKWGEAQKTGAVEIVYQLSDPKQITYLIASPETCQRVKQLSR